MRKIAMFTLTAVLLLLTLSVTSCTGFTNIRYDDAGKYSGDALPPDLCFSSLDVEWVTGEVRILTGDGFSVSETASRKTNGDETLRWFLDGDTLRLRFAAAGARQLGTLEKVLTVTVPENTALASLRVANVAADLRAEVPVTGDMKIETVNGNADVRANAPATLDAYTVDGDLAFSFSRLGSFRLESVNGKMTLSVAGNVPEQGKFDSVSGDLILSLPQDGSFSATFSTVSGFVSGISRNESSVYEQNGGGVCCYSWSTVSGNVFVQTIKAEN